MPRVILIYSQLSFILIVDRSLTFDLWTPLNQVTNESSRLIQVIRAHFVCFVLADRQSSYDDFWIKRAVADRLKDQCLLILAVPLLARTMFVSVKRIKCRVGFSLRSDCIAPYIINTISVDKMTILPSPIILCFYPVFRTLFFHLFETW